MKMRKDIKTRIDEVQKELNKEGFEFEELDRTDNMVLLWFIARHPWNVFNCPMGVDLNMSFITDNRLEVVIGLTHGGLFE